MRGPEIKNANHQDEQQRKRDGKFHDLRRARVAYEPPMDRSQNVGWVHWLFSACICAVAFKLSVNDWNGRLKP